jgi:hypothetical protein
MRRLLFAVLFPLLLIAQQGAFVHSLEHLPGSVGSSKSHDDRQAPSSQYCAKCFTFAHIGAAAGLPAAFVTVSSTAFEAIGFRLPIAPLARVQSPRSRGPPSLL